MNWLCNNIILLWWLGCVGFGVVDGGLVFGIIECILK